MANVTHWTERSPNDFLYSIASDFVEQLQERMEMLPMKQSELARAANVTKGYVSRMFKNPGNLSLITMIRFARIVGMKLSIVGYEDKNDPDNTRGPISADVFRRTWEDAGQPADMWAFEVKTVKQTGPILDCTTFQRGWVLGLGVCEGNTGSDRLFNQTSRGVMRSAHEIVDIQKVNQSLSKKVQGLEVKVNG